MRKIRVIIGPSYAGKSTLCESLIKDASSVIYLKHADYRRHIPTSIILKVFLLFQYVHDWGIRLALMAARSRSASLIIRIAKYSYTSFILTRLAGKDDLVLLDEDFIKKLVDGLPSPLNFTSYLHLRKNYESILSYLIPIYLRAGKSEEYIFLLVDCSYLEASARARKRNLSERVEFSSRAFRARYTLERRIYQRVSQILLASRAEVRSVDVSSYDQTVVKVLSKGYFQA